MRSFISVFFLIFFFTGEILPQNNAQTDIPGKDKNHKSPYDEQLQSNLKKMFDLEVINPDSAIKFGINSIILAEEKGDIVTAASMLGRVGHIYYRKNNLQLAIEFYLRAFPYAKKANDVDMMGYLLIDIGNCYYEQGLSDEAISFYEQSKSIFRSTNHTIGEAVAINNVALCKIKKSDFNSAEEYFREALKLREKIGVPLLLLHSYGYLLDVKRYKKEFDDYEELVNKSLVIIDTLKLNGPYDYEIPVEGLRKIGLLYESMGKNDLALRYLFRALEYNTKSKGDQNLQSRLILDIAGTYKKLGKESEFIEYSLRSLAISKKVNHIRLQKEAYESLAAYYEKKNDLARSLSYIKAVYSLTQKQNDTELKNRLFDLFLFVNVFDKESQLKISKIELEREIEKKKAAQIQLYIVIAGLLIISLFMVVLYRNNLKLKKLNRELEERNSEITRQREEISKQKSDIEKMLEELRSLNRSRDKFYSVFVHDLKNPLYALVSFSEILNNDFSELTEQEKRRFIKNNYELSKKINSLIMDMLEWLSIQLGKTKITTSPVSARHIADIVITRMHQAASDKNIRILNIIPDEVSVMADITSLTSIMQNLLQNAIKFSYPGSEVIVNYSRSAGKVNLIFEDQGVGFTEEQVRLFNNNELIPSTEGTSKEMGTGFGLVIIKDLLKLNNGSILLESIRNKGSKFTVILDEAPNA